MNNKEHIQELILEEYYKIAVKDLFEQVERSARIEKLDNKTQQLIQKSLASRGFKIVVRGRNLKDTISADRIRQMLSGSKQYGIDSVASQSGNMLYVIKNIKNKNRKVVWLVTIYELNRLGISAEDLDQYRKIGNATIVDEKTFTEITKPKPKITKIQKVITNTATQEEEKEEPAEEPPAAEPATEEPPTEEPAENETGIPSLTFQALQDKGDAVKAGLLDGLKGNVEIGATGEVDGDYDGTKSTLSKFIAPLKNIILITSTKRPRKFTENGNISDHWYENKTSYAFDIVLPGKDGKDSKETTTVTGKEIGDHPMDEIFKAMMKGIGSPVPAEGGVYNKKMTDPYDIQVIWRTTGHYNHIHIGLTNLTTFKKELIDKGWADDMAAEKEKIKKDKEAAKKLKITQQEDDALNTLLGL